MLKTIQNTSKNKIIYQHIKKELTANRLK